jgi:hypothetical protein
LFEISIAAEWVAFVDFFMVLLLVFEWLCCVCLQTRLGHGPRHRGRQVQRCGKSGPKGLAEGRRKRILGAARSFFHRLVHARSGAPQQVWFLCSSATAQELLVRVGVVGRNRPAREGGEGHALVAAAREAPLSVKKAQSMADQIGHYRMDRSQDLYPMDE